MGNGMPGSPTNTVDVLHRRVCRCACRQVHGHVVCSHMRLDVSSGNACHAGIRTINEQGSQHGFNALHKVEFGITALNVFIETCV